MELKSLIRNIPDFPIEGIVFRDITTLLKDKNGLKTALDELYNLAKDKGITKVIDADTGEVIKGITKVEITHDVGVLPIVSLEIVSIDSGQYNVEASASFLVMSTVDGKMKPVKTIEFEDGEVIDYTGVE